MDTVYSIMTTSGKRVYCAINFHIHYRTADGPRAFFDTLLCLMKYIYIYNIELPRKRICVVHISQCGKIVIQTMILLNFESISNRMFLVRGYHLG